MIYGYTNRSYGVQNALYSFSSGTYYGGLYGRSYREPVGGSYSYRQMEAALERALEQALEGEISFADIEVFEPEIEVPAYYQERSFQKAAVRPAVQQYQNKCRKYRTTHSFDAVVRELEARIPANKGLEAEEDFIDVEQLDPYERLLYERANNNFWCSRKI